VSQSSEDGDALYFYAQAGPSFANVNKQILYNCFGGSDGPTMIPHGKEGIVNLIVTAFELNFGILIEQIHVLD
jgi:hypothetical protein